MNGERRHDALVVAGATHRYEAAEIGRLVHVWGPR
jgi:hypothetical protein